MTKSKLIILGAVFITFSSCESSTKKESKLEQPDSEIIQINQLSDSVAIKNTIHAFFTWYDANFERLGKIKFVTDSATHLSLNENNLQIYLAEIKKSGFVSDELIEDETRFYKACAEIWKKQKKTEIPEGLQSDRFYCAHDYIAPYNTGNVLSTINDEKASAVLSLTGKKNEKNDFRFELKKENGKWLLSKLGCNFGIVH